MSETDTAFGKIIGKAWRDTAGLELPRWAQRLSQDQDPQISCCLRGESA